MSTQERFQTVRAVDNTRGSQEGVIDIPCQMDSASSEEVVLWEDILLVFKNALFLRHGSRALPFLMKDGEVYVIFFLSLVCSKEGGMITFIEVFLCLHPRNILSRYEKKHSLVPYRVAALPGVVLEVVSENRLSRAQHRAIQDEDTALPPAYTESQPQPPPSEHSLRENTLPDLGVTPQAVITNNITTATDNNNTELSLCLQRCLRFANAGNSDAIYNIAREWYLIGTALNHPQCQIGLAMLYQYGRGVPLNYTKCIDYYLLAVGQGDAIAQHNLGRLYFDGAADDGKGSGSVAVDYKRAMELLKMSAKQGEKYAQHMVGLMYRRAHGVEKDFLAALFWFKKSAAQGHALAQYEIGTLYQFGLGVAKDLSKAIEWLLKAAEQGLDKAEYALGDLYDYGAHGVLEQSYIKAAEWYRRAAEQGHAEAQCCLGTMYQNGEGGLAQSYLVALEWFEKSAAGGCEQAKVNVDVYRRRGVGLAEGVAKAFQKLGIMEE